MADSLWGEDFVVPATPKVAKTIIKKIKEPKEPKVKVERAVKSKKVSIDDKLTLIAENVYKILGRYKDDTEVIKTKEDLISYFDAAIKNGVIALDTETNNSLEPVTCKLMGACLYTPGRKNAYVPVNHINRVTGEKLAWQLTEEDIAEQLLRLKDTKIVMHNGKFDYEVFKCTCGVALDVYWDSLIGARILNENERAGLKEQYSLKVDPTAEKYSIEHLFEGIEYAVVDPDLFALYAATDSYKTYYLYEWQKKQFEKPEHKNLYSVFMNVEMKVLIPTAEMELNGVCIDTKYAARLSAKHHKQLYELEKKIAEELAKYDDKIAAWRLTPEANIHPLSKKPNKAGEYKPTKSKNEQLETPVKLSSNTQLIILLHDVLKIPPIYKEGRGAKAAEKSITVDEEALIKLNEKYNIPLLALILEQRGLIKLINTYIDKIPQCICEKDHRVHASFNQLGADTGRFSSSSPNLQNIPSSNKSIRLMFTASENLANNEFEGNSVFVNTIDEVIVSGEWKRVLDVSAGDKLEITDDEGVVTEVEVISATRIDNVVKIEFEM